MARQSKLALQRTHWRTYIKALIQGGERLGGETSGSERKGVIQWTGSELKSKTKTKTVCSKVRGFGGTEKGIFYPCIVVVYKLKMFWRR